MGKITLQIIVFFLRAYQCTISPLLGSCCRFYPSCSEYAIQAVQQHGLLYGIYLIFRRLLRCHPGCQGGFDPIPEIKKHVNDYA